MRDPAAKSRRKHERVGTKVPALVRLIGSDGGLVARGRGVITDFSNDGVRISEIELQEGGFPSCAHFVMVVPERGALAGLWMKACVVRAAFRRDSAEIGAYIVSSSGGLQKLVGTA
jgi:hypothetical protein